MPSDGWRCGRTWGRGGASPSRDRPSVGRPPVVGRGIVVVSRLDRSLADGPRRAAAGFVAGLLVVHDRRVSHHRERSVASPTETAETSADATRRSGVERAPPAVRGGLAELLLDAQQLVVLRDPVGAAGAPVLICPQLVATARSAIVVSSVSPLRWLITAVYAWRVASSTVSSVSVSVPIWLTLTSTLLATPRSMPWRSRLRVGDEQVVADELDPLAERRR